MNVKVVTEGAMFQLYIIRSMLCSKFVLVKRFYFNIPYVLDNYIHSMEVIYVNKVKSSGKKTL